MPGKKIKKVDGIGQKLLDEAIADFMRHCRLKNLAEATMEYYREDLEYESEFSNTAEIADHSIRR